MNIGSKLLRLRETKLMGLAYVAVQRLRQPSSSKCAVFFPDQLYTGTSGDLRAVAVARELRKLGWRTVIVPPWLELSARRAIVRSEPGALLFFQQSRHPLNNPTLFPGRLAIFDADDADILNCPQRVIECLQASEAVIAGSEFLASKFREFNSNVNVIWTGTYVKRVSPPAVASSTPTLVWAQGDPFDYPHEAALMADLWIRLAEAKLNFAVRVYSREPDRVSQWLEPLTKLGIKHQTYPRMRYREFIASLAGTAIGLQPICRTFAYSQGKSFGKVLAYMAAGVPVVASDEVDHALFFRNLDNGIVVNSLEDWVEACKSLLTRPELGTALAERAYQDLDRELSTKAVATKLDRILSPIVSESRCSSNPRSSSDTNLSGRKERRHWS